jgi:hypothetical protein
MALTERYVSAAGAGDNSGDSEANAMTVAQMVTDLNTPRAGYRYNVKKGVSNYSFSGNHTIAGDGSTTQPNIIRGYNVTPGDVTFVRGSDGKLDTSNMPTWVYDATFRLVASSGDFLQIQGMVIQGDANNPLVNLSDNDGAIFGCVVTNSSNGATATCVTGSSSNGTVIKNNDLYLPNGAAGSVAVSAGYEIEANRIECGPNVDGITSGASDYRNNTIIGCRNGIVKTGTTAAPRITGNTITGCSVDGIDIVTSSTARCVITGNHITGCGGYGIDFNTSTCVKFLAANRFRDNTSGNINGGGDYETATSLMHITSDDTDADDFTNSGSGVYALKTTAAGFQKGLGYLNNIGAVGSPNTGGGSGGGPLVGGRLVQ